MSKASAAAYAWTLTIVFFGRLSAAHASPIELFTAAALDAKHPAVLLLPYVNGGGGFFLSDDRGATFGLVCASAVDESLRDPLIMVQSAGAIYVGAFSGVWRGDANGCGFTRVPELQGHYVAAIAADPLDAKRTYFGSGDAAPEPNQLYLGDDTGVRAFGSDTAGFINSIHVVEVGGARRFYETNVRERPDGDRRMYSVRVSEDEGETWSEYPVEHEESDTFLIVGVDPRQADHVLARVKHGDKARVMFSDAAGQPGSWKMLAELGAFDAFTFTPDGKLYFGDNHQDSPALYVVDETGETPRKLSEGWKVACLGWDDEKKRMLGCSDYFIGDVDLSNGSFTRRFDMHCAQRFVECGDEPPMADRCEAQLLPAYCGDGHYPEAPLCAGYPQSSDLKRVIATFDHTCEGGLARPKLDAGTAADGGIDAATAADAGPAAPGNAGGCGCNVARAHSPALASFALLACVTWLRLRTKCRSRDVLTRRSRRASASWCQYVPGAALAHGDADRSADRVRRACGCEAEQELPQTGPCRAAPREE